MRREGAAMLRAAVLDLLKSTDLQVIIPLAHESASPLAPHPRVRLVPLPQHRSLALELPKLAATAELVLIIAPETDGILVELLRIAESAMPESALLLNLDSATTVVFSDKLRTFRWLGAAQLPTPDTLSATHSQAEQLLCHRSTSDGCRVAASTDWVLKPRDGAGSDRVCVVAEHPSLLGRRNEGLTILEALPSIQEAPWVVQRRLEGISCSVGIIGHGPDREAGTMPVVVQQIDCDGTALRYCGGSIPAPDPVRIAMTELAKQFTAHLEPWWGYVGIDAVCDPMSGAVQGIVEINPRLCTSFVGYHHLADTANIGSLLTPTSDIRTLPETPIRFTTAGEVSAAK